MHGIVVSFDREKGYGFIRSDQHPGDLFFHIREVQNRQELFPGQQVTFDPEKNDRGWTAVRVIPGRKRISPYMLYGTPACLFTFTLTAYLAIRGFHIGFAYLLSVNACTFVAYGYDKWIAGTSLLRVPEWILHGLAFAGGSPLALIGQKVFRHKTIKRSFQFLYWAIVIFQVVLLICLFVY